MLDLSAGVLDRPWHRRLVVHHRHRRLQQADAAAHALARVRRRHRRRLVRAISVFAAGGGFHRLVRLAARADRFRPHYAADDPAVDRGAHAADGSGSQLAPPASSRCATRWPKHSAIAPTCCWCSASSPAASSCCSSPCICRPIWSTADCRSRSAPGRSASSACSISSARSPPAGSATACPSAICCRSSTRCARSRWSFLSCCR